MIFKIDQRDVNQIVNQAIQPEALSDEIMPTFIADGVERFGQERLDELEIGIDFNLRDPNVVEFLERQAGDHIVDINLTTRNTVRNLLREGVDAGEDINTLTRRVRTAFDNPRRSATIARTESLRALNHGQVEATRQAGFEGKQWLSTRDEDVRDTHKPQVQGGMDGQIVPISADFVSPSGATGPHPGAMSTAAESVNCRCTTLAVRTITKAVWPAHLNTEYKRRMYWKSIESDRKELERKLLRRIRAAFRRQRDLVVDALNSLDRQSSIDSGKMCRPSTKGPNMPGDNILDTQAFKASLVAGKSQDGKCLRKQYVTDSIKAVGDDDDRTLEFIISTSAVDRHGDIVAANGFELANFRKNPVVLFAHDASQAPIAKATEVGIKDGRLVATAQFMSPSMDQFRGGFADSVFQMLRGGFLRATSVGFRPLAFEPMEDGNGIKFTKHELLEFSVVPVPANPEALISAKAAGVNMQPYLEWVEETIDEWARWKDALMVPREFMEQLMRKASGSKAIQLSPEAESALRKTNLGRVHESDAGDHAHGGVIVMEPSLKGPMALFSQAKAPLCWNQVTAAERKQLLASWGMVDKGAISFDDAHSEGTPLADKDEAWDGPAEVAEADITSLGTMSAWVRDIEGDEELAKADFKLPHHKAGGDHATVFRGVQAAMGALLGARGGVDIPADERRGVYDHLAKHYPEFDEEPPEFRLPDALEDADDAGDDDEPVELGEHIGRLQSIETKVDRILSILGESENESADEDENDPDKDVSDLEFEVDDDR